MRLARQVSHPNVCRVHDLAEAEGHHFVTMEYVDGEDLRSLLRRGVESPTIAPRARSSKARRWPPAPAGGAPA